MLEFIRIFVRSAARERHFLLTNRWDFSIAFWLPSITIALVWAVFSRAYVVDVPIGLINESHGRVSEKLVQYVDATPEATIYRQYGSVLASKPDLMQRNIYGVLVIPENFDKNVLSGQSADVVFHVNAQYGTHSGVLQKGIRQAVGTLSAGVEIATQVKRGTFIESAKNEFSPIQIQRVSLFNTSTDYQQFLASTVLPALLHILAMIIGATTIGRELRDKSLHEWVAHLYGKTANDELPEGQRSFWNFWWHLMAGLNGKFIWAMLAYALWGAVTLSLATQTHDAGVAPWLLTYATFLLFMMVSFWLGAIFTLLAMSLREGLSMAALISAPSFAFAGVTYPVIGMSEKAQGWSNALPLTHYLNVHIPQLQMGAPLSLSLPISLWFLLSVFVCMQLSILLCRGALKKPEKWGAR